MTTTSSGTGSAPLRVALTGAAGSLAADILPGLVDHGYQIVAIDTRRPTTTGDRIRWVQCSINDRDALATALTGCDAVVHLAGIPLEDDWERLLTVNIDGTQAVLDTARRCHISRVVLASSIHAAGYVAVPDDRGYVPDDVPARPNTFYGVSKAAGEALGSLYHDRYGLDVICLRIASRCARPENERMLSTWLSPADALRLFEAALTVPTPGFRLVWGVSANSRSYLSPAGGREIGYHPSDNAEFFTQELHDAACRDPQVAASEWDRRFIGGVFSSPHPPRYRAAEAAEENQEVSR